MSELELPPLPEPELLGAEVAGHTADFYGHTDQQLREFARVCIEGERDRCAKVCKAEEALYAQASKSAKTELGVIQFEAMGVGAGNCAEAIRKG